MLAKPVLHPVAPKKGNAGVRMLAGSLEVSLVHLVRDAHAHRKVVLALSVQGKSMLSLTEDPSPRSLGIVPTSSVRVSSTTQPRTTRTDFHLSWKRPREMPESGAKSFEIHFDRIMCLVCAPTTAHSNPALPDHVMDAVRLMPPITSRGGAFAGGHTTHTLTLHNT